MVGTASPTAPLDKGKGLVVVPSNEEEDTAEGLVFKRKRTTTMATSHSTSQKDAQAPRENLPSALTPLNYMALGEGAETNPEPTPTSAPELPDHLLKGLQQTLPENPTAKL